MRSGPGSVPTSCAYGRAGGRDHRKKNFAPILAADQLIMKPRLYSTFLLWMLSELFELLPEVGERRLARVEGRVGARGGECDGAGDGDDVDDVRPTGAGGELADRDRRQRSAGGVEEAGRDAADWTRASPWLRS